VRTVKGTSGLEGTKKWGINKVMLGKSKKQKLEHQEFSGNGEGEGVKDEKKRE